MKSFLRSLVSSYYIYLKGRKLDKKVIVFESDDWGMIRTSSIQAYDRLIKRGYPLNRCIYSSNDSLERTIDIEGLLDVLNKNTSQSGSKPIFTINNVVCNPDFEKIKQSGFTVYHRETFDKTLRRYENSEGVLDCYRQGIKGGVLQPQYHATEHVNINNWVVDLRTDQTFTRDAFDEGMSTIHRGWPSSCHNEYLDAYGSNDGTIIEPQDKTLELGLNAFETLWGTRSKSFIAPCYTWHSSMDSILAKHGIRFIQGSYIQREPTGNGGKFRKRYHYQGQKGMNGLTYLVRNCSFETAELPNRDWVDSCMNEISRAFEHKQPAIVSTHRVNFIGRLREANRDTGLKLLNELLQQINRQWRDVEYMTSNELGELLNSD